MTKSFLVPSGSRTTAFSSRGEPFFRYEVSLRREKPQCLPPPFLSFPLRLMTPGQAAAGPDISPAFNVISIPFGSINRTELAQARSGRRQELIVFGKDLR